MKIMLSSCLIGKDVMYWGGNLYNEEFMGLISSNPKIEIVHFCPEHIMLGTPRKNMLIHGGDGSEIWDGEARLLDTDGEDVTSEMKVGAEKMLAFALQERPNLIILTEGSDSCGVNSILDSDYFSENGKNKLKPGIGLAAYLLKRNGFYILSHTQVDEIKNFIQA